MLLLGTALILLGWCLLVLAMPRHHQALRGRPAAPGRARVLRIAAALALAASLACYVAVIGWEQGPVFWTCALMLSALAWPLLLAALPDRSPRRRR
jgi:drug/metabolite transporter (DMT)-like permease